MLDEGPAIDPIATRSLAPIMDLVGEVLEELGADPAAGERIAEALGRAYVAGLTDGARDAIGQIAAEAGRHGLHLSLAPELEADQAGGPPGA